MKVVNSAMSSELSCASSAPDLTCASAGSSGWMSEISSAGVEPSTPATEIASYWPSRSKSVCAVATSKIANVALPSDLTSPYCAIPTTSKSCFGFSVEIAIVSPSAKSSRSAVPASTTTSRSFSGQRPSSRLSGLKTSYSGEVSRPKPKLGAPFVLIAFPSSPTIFVLTSS